MPLPPTLSRSLLVALARRASARGSGADVVAWAERALSEADSPSLRILAGLTPLVNEFEVDEYLRRTSGELGFALPTPDELPPAFARLIAGDILSGALAPHEGCRELFHLSIQLSSPSFLRRWVELDDALELAREGIVGTVREAEAEIRAEARYLLEGAP